MAARSIRIAECVRVPDGRIGRVRAIIGSKVRVRVRRRTSPTHQFVLVPAARLRRVACPQGWMSPAGYARYLRITLTKMRRRMRRRRPLKRKAGRSSGR
jgi:hypothetical protein